VSWWAGLLGVIVGGGLTWGQAYSQRTWAKRDRLEEEARADAKALATSRKESDAASLRGLMPLIRHLQTEWNALGGGPTAAEGAVRDPDPAFYEAFQTFQVAYYEKHILDSTIHEICFTIYYCARSFITETDLWRMWRSNGPGSPAVSQGISETQDARSRLTGEFRSLYDTLQTRVVEYVGENRLA